MNGATSRTFVRFVGSRICSNFRSPRLEGQNKQLQCCTTSREWKRTNCVRKRTRQPQQQPDEHTRAQPLQDATALHVHTIPTRLYPRPLCHKTTKHLASTHQYPHPLHRTGAIRDTPDPGPTQWPCSLWNFPHQSLAYQ